MKTLPLLAPLGLLVTGVLATGQILTGPTTNPSNGHHYYLTSQSTWTAAEATALSLGGHLATIQDAAENAWVFSTFSQYGDQPRNLWIGLSSGLFGGSVPDNFAWSSGEISLYLNFAPSEPNVPQEQYVYMLAPGLPISGMWNNWYDGDATGYTSASGNLPLLPLSGVIELVPEPSTLALLALACLAALATAKHRSAHLRSLRVLL